MANSKTLSGKLSKIILWILPVAVKSSLQNHCARRKNACLTKLVGKQVEVSEECIDSSEILGFKGTVDMKKLFDTDKRNCRVLSAGISDLGFCEVGAFHCSEELNETNNFVVRPLWIGWDKTKQSLRSVIEADAEQIDLLKLVSRFPCPHVTC